MAIATASMEPQIIVNTHARETPHKFAEETGLILYMQQDLKVPDFKLLLFSDNREDFWSTANMSEFFLDDFKKVFMVLW